MLDIIITTDDYGRLNFISNIFEFSKTVIVKKFNQIKEKQGKT